MISKKRNSQSQIIDFLRTVECATESEIQQEVWNYYRSSRYAGSNKKYADILRRAWYSGKIDRVKAAFKGKDTRKYWYYFIKK